MFKLEITKLDNNVVHDYNMNLNDDDFLQFVCKEYAVDPRTNLDIYIMPDEWKDELEAYLKLGDEYKLDKSQVGKLVVNTVVEVYNEVTESYDETVTLIKEYVGEAIIYPYDLEGNFLPELQAVGL